MLILTILIGFVLAVAGYVLLLVWCSAEAAREIYRNREARLASLARIKAQAEEQTAWFKSYLTDSLPDLSEDEIMEAYCNDKTFFARPKGATESEEDVIV